MSYRIEYIVVEGSNVNELNRIVNEKISVGWKPEGSHQVVNSFTQNRFSGQQHMSTTYQMEYTQTMMKMVDNDMEQFKLNKED